jgi:hypothetical protein
VQPTAFKLSLQINVASSNSATKRARIMHS